MLEQETQGRVSIQGNDSPAAGGVRVLHVIHGEHYAGAERVQDHLALRLPEYGFHVELACLKPGRFAEMRIARQTPLHAVPMRGRMDLRAAIALTRLVQQGRYALLHTHSPRGAMVGSLAAAWTGVPLVHHAHSTLAEIRPWWLARINARLERFSLRGAAGVIAVSAGVASHLRAHGYARQPMWLVPNGVPVQEDLSTWPRVGRPWTLGTVALFRPCKCVEVLLEAMALLIAQGYPVQLRAVGRFETPEYEKELRGRAAALGVADAVQWVGFRSDVVAELRQMDLFVLPSPSEGLSMAVLEAMSAGTPVLGMRVCGVADVVCDGETGLLAAPNDAADLARVMRRVFDGQIDVERMRREARQCQAEGYSDVSMAAGVAGVYRAILDHRIAREPSPGRR